MTPHDLPAPYTGPLLRLAWIGNGRHPWCSEVHFTKSMESLGHNVTFLQEDEMDWAQLPALVIGAGIQAVFWTRTWPAEMAVVEPVLKELATEGIPTISYHLDRWFGLDRAHQVDDQPFFRTSLVVSPDDSPQWAEHGVNHFWLPPGVYGPECEPVPPNPRRWPFDVVFVGSHPYPHPEWQKYRTDLLSAFRAAFGRRFAILPRERRGTPIRGRDLQELYATVPVVLGDSCLAGTSSMYWSDRCPESLGRGAAFIHPIVQDMDAWYEHLGPRNVMLGYFQGDFDQAVQSAKWVLQYPEAAKSMAERGRATVMGRDTYAHRMGTVLAVAEGIYGGYREVVDERPSGVTRLGPLPDVVRKFLVDANYGRPVPDAVPCVPPPCPAEEIMWVGLPSLRVKLNRWSAVFEPRPGTTDAEVIGEVWGTNDYRVPPEGFRGTVVDTGANVGAFSVLAAKAGVSQVYAVEPQADNYGRLLHHIRSNGVERFVSPLPFAVTGEGTEYVEMVGEGGGARAVPVTSVSMHTDPLVTTLALLLVEVGPVEFLKMDIEGGEYDAFAACPVEALGDVDRIALEFHGPAMPHLSHLDDDGKHLERWGALVAKLADAGRVETFGHPMRGGLIWWKRYGA